MVVDVNAFRGKVFDATPENTNSQFFDVNRKELKAKGQVQYVVRFLPYNPNKPVMIELFQHAIQNSAKKFLFKPCLHNIGAVCPICSEAQKYYAAKMDTVGTSLWRKRGYISNIQIVNDPYNPENNGNVKPFRFGKQLLDTINTLCKFNTNLKPFDIFNGNNLILIVIMENGQPKYSFSQFDQNFTQVTDIDVTMSKVVDLSAEFCKAESFVLENDAILFDEINTHVMNAIVPFNANYNTTMLTNPAPVQQPVMQQQPVYQQPAMPQQPAYQQPFVQQPAMPVMPQQPAYQQPVMPTMPQQVMAQQPAQTVAQAMPTSVNTQAFNEQLDAANKKANLAEQDIDDLIS